MMMEIINRSAVIVKPRQPYLEWIRQDDPEGLAERVFETFHTEPTVYLLPEYEDPPTQHEVLEEFGRRGWANAVRIACCGGSLGSVPYRRGGPRA